MLKEYCYINDNGCCGRALRSEDDQAEIKKTWEAANYTDCYMSVYSYDCKNFDEANLYGPMYFDLDGEQSDEGFKQVVAEAEKILAYLKSLGMGDRDYEIWFSGAKGLHIIIPPEVMGVTPMHDLNKLYRAWAEEIKCSLGLETLDMKIYDRRRIFRVPGTINSKTGAFKRTFSMEWDKDLDYDRVVLYSKNPLLKCNYFDEPEPVVRNESFANAFSELSTRLLRDEEKTATAETDTCYRDNSIRVLTKLNKQGKKGYVIPYCVAELLDRDIKVGERDRICYILAVSLFNCGIEYSEVTDIMAAWDSYLSAPLGPASVAIKVKSAYNQAFNKGKNYKGSIYLNELGNDTKICIGCPLKCKASRLS